jgi:CHAT domain-containing protein
MRSLFAKDGSPSSDALAKEVERLSAEYAQVEAEIRTTSPGYASITQPNPLAAVGIQSELEDDRTALLEYSLGEERSYAWLVLRNSIRSFELPPKKTIEDLARSFYELVALQNGPLRDATAARQRAKAELLAMRLGAMLIGPVQDAIQGKRLVIVPDGVLCYIPFDALGEPGAPSGRYTPLLAAHTISSLPSASVLPIIRSQSLKRMIPPKMVAVFADPVFDRSDPRVRTAGRGIGPARPSAANLSDHPQTRSVQTASLNRLVFSRREAQAIYSLFPNRLAKLSLDFRANLSAVTGPGMAEYRIVHLATHGFLDSEHPDRSALVLSLVDQDGNAQQGFLKVADIFNLQLPAELVVLSACQTALGSDIKGEGLVGLTRAFMYAGAKRVIASLWKVDDLATAELMTAFYRSLAAGKNPAVALQAAKLALIRKPAWSSPYYWAGFELQGEFEGSPSVARGQ